MSTNLLKNLSQSHYDGFKVDLLYKKARDRCLRLFVLSMFLMSSVLLR